MHLLRVSGAVLVVVALLTSACQSGSATQSSNISPSSAAKPAASPASTSLDPEKFQALADLLAENIPGLVDFKGIRPFLSARIKYFDRGAALIDGLSSDPTLANANLETLAERWRAVSVQYSNLKNLSPQKSAVGILALDPVNAACTVVKSVQMLKAAGLEAPMPGGGQANKQAFFADALNNPKLCDTPFAKGYPKVYSAAQLQSARNKLSPYSTRARVLTFVLDAGRTDAYVAVAPDLYSPYPISTSVKSVWQALESDWFGTCNSFEKWAPILGHPLSGAGLCM